MDLALAAALVSISEIKRSQVSRVIQYDLGYMIRDHTEVKLDELVS